jgi:hypothetical protein
MRAFKYGKSFAGIVYLNIFVTYLFPHVVPEVHEIDRGIFIRKITGFPVFKAKNDVTGLMELLKRKKGDVKLSIEVITVSILVPLPSQVF